MRAVITGVVIAVAVLLLTADAQQPTKRELPAECVTAQVLADSLNRRYQNMPNEQLATAIQSSLACLALTSTLEDPAAMVDILAGAEQELGRRDVNGFLTTIADLWQKNDREHIARYNALLADYNRLAGVARSGEPRRPTPATTDTKQYLRDYLCNLSNGLAQSNNSTDRAFAAAFGDCRR